MRQNLFAFGFVFLAPVAACDSLTAPSEPVAIVGESTTTTAAAAPAASASASAKPAATAPAASAAPAPPIDPNAKLTSTDLAVGTGAACKAGDKVAVHYVGTLTDGTKFDASRDHGTKPFTFTLGKGMVIKGWDDGVAGMKVGGKRKLVIPPNLGYGSRGMGKIPAGSTLVFEVELMAINPTDAQ